MADHGRGVEHKSTRRECRFSPDAHLGVITTHQSCTRPVTPSEDVVECACLIEDLPLEHHSSAQHVADLCYYAWQAAISATDNPQELFRKPARPRTHPQRIN